MNKHKKKYILIPIITAIISLVITIAISINKDSKLEKTYSDFSKDIASDKVDTVYLTNSAKIKILLKDGSEYKTDNPRSSSLKETLLISGVKVVENAGNSAMEILPPVVLGLSMVGILVLFARANGAAYKKYSSVDAIDVNSTENAKYSFKNVAGNEEAKESVNDVVDFLKNPQKYASYGARMPKGIILYGEPGTGKTLLAKAVAGEASVPFYAMSGSDFVQVYVGVGASRIRSLFKKAKAQGKAVIFIDEIDAIGKKRDANKAGGSDERDQTLNALLTEMSGFNDNDGIVVIAATNRLDMLDSALLRPGRFDRHIEVTLPDVAAREKILNLHLQGKPIGDINVKEWAQKTSYFSGAKLESLVNEAAILACKEDSKYINDSHMDKAFSIVVAGHEKMDRQAIKEKDRRITAYHEVGHALVSLCMLPEDKVSKVTIIPSTKGAGGYTLSIPADHMFHNMEYLKRRIMVLLAGRVAEEIIFGKDYVTTGAYNDIKQATNIVTKMVTEYGMGRTLGLLSLDEINNSFSANPNQILDECKTLVDNLYEETKQLLLKESDKLETITQVLLEKETLLSEELYALAN
ncbi:ATP-dependent metallopeptidase FtsH/Yme1/Tma family protein [Clostridium thermarum]|uniref:ATP-dependent metallopeptidase FtsH/Yme1/Tma family protein n=1 Tax=Clostridium thermarum TaxID=1716543 RepID=UPI00111E2432|nr:ATP-dependent metallopeptidase FtsH/Yme1/Tma family protein [Clostridium thermarum]